MTWTGSGQSAPASGTPKGFGFFRAVFEYIYSKYNAHVDNTVHADQHTASAILANEASYLLTTARAITGATLHAEQDMWRREIANIWDGDFTAATWAGRYAGGVPINLLTTRNELRGGLGTGDGTADPTTAAPNIIPRTVIRRDQFGFVSMVTRGQSSEQLRELRAIAGGTSALFVPAGKFKRPGALPIIWGGGSLTMPAANATQARYDTLYLGVNESGTAFLGAIQGTLAANIGAAPLSPDPPDGTFFIDYVARLAAPTAGTAGDLIDNFSNTAGGTFAPTAGRSYILPLHERGNGGTAPLDGTILARKLKDFAPLPTSPPSKSIVFSPAQAMLGGTTVDFAGVTVTYDAGGNYDGVHANPTSPAGGTVRWDAVSVNSVGQLIITPGTPAANFGVAAQPTMPTVNTAKQVCFLALRGGQAAIWGYQSVVNGTINGTDGWIQDTIRFSNTMVSTASTTTTFANVVDDANSGSYADDFASTSVVKTSDNFKANLSVSGAVVTLIATSTNKVWAAINGRKRTISATITNTYTAAGSTGWRYLVVDLSAASPGFTMSVHTTNDANPTSYTAMVYPVWWDGTNLSLDPGGVDNIDSSQVNLYRVQAQFIGASGNLTNTSNYAVIGTGGSTGAMQTTPTGSFFVPPGCMVKFQASVSAYVNFIAANPVSVGVLMDGANQPLAGTIKSSTLFTASGPWEPFVFDEVLVGNPASAGTYGSSSLFIGPGLHSFTLGFNTGAGGGSINFLNAKLLVEVYRAPSAVLG